ncbi:hypothetical protein [Kocuria sp. U4B]
MGRKDAVSPVARVVRGAIAGILSVAVAGVSHYAVDTAAPSPGAVAVSVAVAVGVGVLLAGHRMGPARLASAVAISQGAYHLLFARTGANTAASHSLRGAEPAPGHTHPAALPAGLPDLSSAVPAHWPMLLLHLLAAVVTYLALRHGERAWWSLVDVLGAPLRRLLAVAFPWEAARRPVGRPGRFFHYDLHDLGCALRIITPRGPPGPVS